MVLHLDGHTDASDSHFDLVLQRQRDWRQHPCEHQDIDVLMALSVALSSRDQANVAIRIPFSVRPGTTNPLGDRLGDLVFWRSFGAIEPDHAAAPAGVAAYVDWTRLSVRRAK